MKRMGIALIALLATGCSGPTVNVNVTVPPPSPPPPALPSPGVKPPVGMPKPGAKPVAMKPPQLPAMPSLPAIGSPISELLKHMPHPLAVTHDNGNDTYAWKGLRVLARDQKVDSVEVHDKQFHPPAGPGVGANIKDVTAGMGNPDAVQDRGNGVSAYVYSKLGLVFLVKDGRVTGVVMGKPQLPDIAASPPALPFPVPGAASASPSPSDTDTPVNGIPIPNITGAPPLPGPPHPPGPPGGGPPRPR